MKNNDLIKFYNHTFDFDNQHKDTYNDWIIAFENAIANCCKPPCFMGMSSGYDSGAIYHELLRQRANFKAYSIFNNENESVILQRLAFIPNHRVIGMGAMLWKDYQDRIRGKVNDVAFKDTATTATAYMFDLATRDGYRVYISGQGADEIISDYALFPRQSTFKGVFPDKLYEWPNFKESMQRIYTSALEEVANIYGIAIRYPFLDVDLVQEFLWLTPQLKNANYKAPLHEYLTLNKVPFESGVKRGFRPIK